MENLIYLLQNFMWFEGDSLEELIGSFNSFSLFNITTLTLPPNFVIGWEDNSPKPWLFISLILVDQLLPPTFVNSLLSFVEIEDYVLQYASLNPQDYS